MRYAISFVIGAVMGAALFYLMQYLAAPSRPANTSATIELRTPVQVLDDQPVQRKPRVNHTSKLPDRPKAPPSPRAPQPPQPAHHKLAQPHLVDVGYRLPEGSNGPELVKGTNIGTGLKGSPYGSGNHGAMATLTVAPVYPPIAERDGTEGWVEVEFTVGLDGSVHDAQVVRSHPHGVFDAAALRAISRWQFKPAYEDGHPVQRRFTQTINFKLDGDG